MDIRKIKKLIELLEKSGIAESEIQEGEESVRIIRMPAADLVPQATHLAAAPTGASAPTAAEVAAAESAAP